MKKRIIITIVVVILLGIIFMKPISFYVTILSNGYHLTQIENYKITQKTQHGKSRLVIVKGKEESFNLILLSDEQSLLWHMEKAGSASTEKKPYSWLKWDKWLIEENGDLSTRTYKTIIFKKKSKVRIDTDKIPSSLECKVSQYKKFTIVDISTKSANEKELDKLDLTQLVKF